jgi:Rad3-related DNA helicase
MNLMEANTQQRANDTLASLYQAVTKRWAGFAARPGQRQMMDVALRTMLQSKEEGDERDGANIACIEGKTGTGKTLGYLLPAIAVAEATGMTVLVSTATVALQEQLFYRDVPRLATISPIPFDYKLLKGRNRYVCHDKLEQQLIGAVQGSVLETDDGAENAPAQQQKVKLLKSLMQTLTDESWDGDRDTLKEAPSEQLWGRIQNDTNTCLRRHCAYFKECSYFKARRLASKANIVLANHDLVLSVLTGSSGLFDSRSLAAYAPLADRPYVRFANGELPEAFQAMSSDMLLHLEKLAESLQTLRESVKTKVEDAASANEKLLAAKALQKFMPSVQRVVEMFELWTGWAENGRVPQAKWIERSVRKGKAEYTLACSDLTAAATLSRHLWKSARAVVLTSATLTACGSFDFFAKQAELKRLPRVNYLAVESPFDFKKQGEIVVPNMRSTPKASEQHTMEISEVLPALLGTHNKGQLMLFASRRQMQAVYDALPSELEDRVLVQGALPRQKPWSSTLLGSRLASAPSCTDCRAWERGSTCRASSASTS